MKTTMCGCAAAVTAMVGAGGVVGTAAASIDYVSQSRTYEYYAYSDPRGVQTGAAADFSPFDVVGRADGFGQHGEHAWTTFEHHSTLGAEAISAATDVMIRGEHFGPGVGGGTGRATVEVTFTLATAQRYDFVVFSGLNAPGGNYGMQMVATLQGVGGAGGQVFSMLQHPGQTQRFGGVLQAGTYNYRLVSEFWIGPMGQSNYWMHTNLTIPAPGSVLALAGGVLVMRRRR